VAHSQLISLGFSVDAIRHRLVTGRLHRLWRGVYAVGRPELTQHGAWMAAVVCCGPGSVLSHLDAAALWEFRPARNSSIHVSVRSVSCRRHFGIVVHRRTALRAGEVTVHQGIPVTTPICTLIDISTCLDRGSIEAAINEADKRDLVDPEHLRMALDRTRRRPGVGVLRVVLDRRTFTLTGSELERRFLPIARSAGLSPPRTGHYLNGFNVDFFRPELGLVVETDGLRYHRTPAQQSRDRLRDQAHAAAGLTPLRFTHAQVRFEPRHVQATLEAVARRLRYGAGVLASIDFRYAVT
jgi:very-short-patch-repair endonuclease